jgi:antitoxin VapB
MDKTAKLFTNGGSQAVRLPAEFRFDGELVYVRRDETTGDVILSHRPAKSWAHFVALRDELGPVPHAKTFMSKRPLNNRGTVLRDPFDGGAG